MKQNVKFYTLSILIFLCILSLCDGFSEPFSLIVRIVAFAIPSVLSLRLCRVDFGKGENFLGLNKKCAFIIPLALPALFVVFSLSYLVSLIIFTLTGLESTVPASGNLLFDLFSLALIPALLEELLFRYIPLKTFAPYSKKNALIISSVFFAMVHTSFFSIPYALAAGILFMLFDLMTESIWPSVILHLLNNIISIAWIYGSGNAAFVCTFIWVFALVAALSLIPALFMIKKYHKLLCDTFSKEDRPSLPVFTLALIIPTALIAILQLIT